MSSGDVGRCYLYRFYGGDGSLLYVGITDDLIARLASHRRTAGWWSAVARTESVIYPTRRAAEYAEAVAIRSERPAHNRARPTAAKVEELHCGTDTSEHAALVRVLAEVERLRAEVATQKVQLVQSRALNMTLTDEHAWMRTQLSWATSNLRDTDALMASWRAGRMLDQTHPIPLSYHLDLVKRRAADAAAISARSRAEYDRRPAQPHSDAEWGEG